MTRTWENKNPAELKQETERWMLEFCDASQHAQHAQPTPYWHAYLVIARTKKFGHAPWTYTSAEREVEFPDAAPHPQAIVENGAARHTLLILPLFSWPPGVHLFVASDMR